MDAPTLADNLCRACVQDLSIDKTGETIPFVNILETPDLLNKLSSCISNEFSTNIYCSKYLCMDCFQIVNEFYEFWEMCLDSIYRFEERVKKFSNSKEVIIKEEYKLTDSAVPSTSTNAFRGSHECGNDLQKAQRDKCQKSTRRVEELQHRKDLKNLNEDIVKEEYEFNDQPLTLNRSNEYIEACQRIFATQEVKDEDLEHAVRCKNEFISDEDDIEFILVDDSENSQEESFQTTATKLEIIKNVGENCQKKRATQEVEDAAITLVDVEHNMSILVDDSENSQEESLQTTETKLEILKNVGENCQNTRATQEVEDAAITLVNEEHNDATKKLSKSYFCEKCPARFCSQIKFTDHTRKHLGVKPYICPREGCDKSFNEWFELSRHRIAQHDKKSYRCNQENCNKIYTREHNLIMHKQIHKQLGVDLESLHECKICGREFKRSKLLEYHFKKHFKKQRHLKYQKRDRICPYSSCKAVFKSIQKLRDHVRYIHLDESYMLFECRYCDLKFDKSNTLKYHEMRHTGEKPNVCSECGKGFIQPSVLRVHMKLHKRSSDDVPK